MNIKTFTAKPHLVQKKWYVVDAEDKTLGRLASRVAHILRGKHKPEFTPHVDTGDFVVIVNAEKVRVTGNKLKDKIYYSHSEYPGGLKSISFEKLRAKAPTRILTKAIKGMLPKGPLGYAMLKKLKVYAGPTHRHVAQQPELINIETGN
jgi:large subunit ribosomal protein L13